MKKSSTPKDTLRTEYKRSDFPGGFSRGKYATRAAAGSNIAVLDSEVATAFPTSEAVNQALRTILEAARQVAVHPQPGDPVDGRVTASRQHGRG